MFRFLKTPKHKTFTHTPIYFDPAEEDLKKRIASIEGEKDGNTRKIARGSLKESWGRTSRNASSSRTSNIRLIFIIFCLGLAAWLLFYK